MEKLTIQEMNRLTVDQFHDAEKIPLVVVLDDVRSLYNVGSVFRTSDAFRVEGIHLCGITATPDSSLKASQEIHKTALGAEDSVSWQYFSNTEDSVTALKAHGYTILAIEQCHGSINFDHLESAEQLALTNQQEPIAQQKPIAQQEPAARSYAIVFGNEVNGVKQSVVDMCDGCLEIPQYGTKHSLNVSVTAGIVIHRLSQLMR